MNNLLAASRLFLRRNSPTVLTFLGAAGVAATAVMAVKATPKALRVIEQAKEEKGEELTKLEVVNTAGPLYIPAVIVGASTIACIFGANILNQRQQASLMSAYALANASYKEYVEKVRELQGDEVAEQIRNEIVKDKYDEEDIPITRDKILFFDFFSMNYFESTIGDVLCAENRFNHQLKLSGTACLNELYDMLGIERVDYGYQLGWSTQMLDEHGADKVVFVHDKVPLEDGLECYIIAFEVEPSENYMYY